MLISKEGNIFAVIEDTVFRLLDLFISNLVCTCFNQQIFMRSIQDLLNDDAILCCSAIKKHHEFQCRNAKGSNGWPSY